LQRRIFSLNSAGLTGTISDIYSSLPQYNYYGDYELSAPRSSYSLKNTRVH